MKFRHFGKMFPCLAILAFNCASCSGFVVNSNDEFTYTPEEIQEIANSNNNGTNKNYNASSDTSVNSYTVTWRKENGEVLRVDRNVLEGTLPTFDEDPSYAVGDLVYSFVKWKPVPTVIHADSFYTAIYTVVHSYLDFEPVSEAGEVTSYVVSGFNYDDVKEINIPSTFNDLPVKGIKKNAFRYTSVERVILNDGIEFIGENAFANSSLTSIELPSSLKEIDNNAFKNTKIDEINLPSGLNSIGEYAFANTNIEYISIPSSVTSIGGHVFSDCLNLRHAHIGSGIKNIPDFMFYNSGIVYLEMPRSVISIGKYISADSNLILIDYQGNENDFNSINVDLSTLVNGYNNKPYIRYNNFLPEGPRFINSSLQIWVNDSEVIEVAEVSSGQTHTYNGNNPSKESDEEFDYDFKSWVLERQTDKSDKVYKASFGSVKKSFNLTFNGNNGIYNIVTKVKAGEIIAYPEIIPEKEGYVFVGWDNYIEKMPTNDLVLNAKYVTNTTAGCAITKANGITTFTTFDELINQGLVYLDETNTYLQRVRTSDSDAIYVAVILPNYIKRIKDYCFDTNVDSIYVQKGVTAIDDVAFGGVKASQIKLPDTLLTIGMNAFCNSGLTSIVIPESVTSIGSGLFESCSNLKEVVFPKNIKEIPSETFIGCSFDKFTIQNGITKIGDSAFGRCKNLETINIPSSVTEISQIAFYMCDKLTTINFGGSESQWNSILAKFSNGKLALSTTPVVNFNA